MYGYGGYKKIGYGGGSVSGWERSHYGGYNRVLSDYPYVTMNYELEIVLGDSIKSLGNWMGTKLIKIYLLKMKEIVSLDEYAINKGEKVIKKSFMGFGADKEYMSISLDSIEIFREVCSANTELKPMFVHHKDGILESFIEYELADTQGEGEGEGEDEGDDNGDQEEGGQGGQGQDEQGETQEGDGDGNQEEDSDGENEGSGGEGEGGEQKKSNEGSNEKDKYESMNSKNGTKISDLMGSIKENKPFNYDSKRNLSTYDKKAKFVEFPHEKKNRYRFTPEEIKNGEFLVKLLDIDFEPKSDVVKSLRLGKLDVSKIAEVPAGNLSVYSREVEDQDTQPFSVCILADLSGSMGAGTRRENQLAVLNSLYLSMRTILPDDKLYIYGHTGRYSPEIYTFYSPYDTEYEKNIQNYYELEWCQNYDGPVVEAIHKKVRERTDDRVIFISLSDGEPWGDEYGGPETNAEFKTILEKTRRDSFVTVGIGIKAPHVQKLYTYSKVVWDLEDLPKEVSGVINKVVRSEFK